MSQYKYSGKFLEYIYEEDTLLAIIIKSDFTSEGIEFFTPNEFSQQLGYMKRETGYIIQPHIHKPVERKIQYTNEVLFIKTGSLFQMQQILIKQKITIITARRSPTPGADPSKAFKKEEK